MESAPRPERIFIHSKETLSAPMKEVAFYAPEDDASFDSIQLETGDVIGFVMSHREAGAYLRRAKWQKVPYEIFRFGHVALVTPERTLLSVCMGEPVTAHLTLDSLRSQSWFVFRPPAGAVHPGRLAEFVTRVTEKASSKKAYDLTAASGLWNANPFPESLEEMSSKYTCSTLIIAALNYSGYRVDAVHRGGVLDIVTPRQVIDSYGIVVRLSEQAPW
ncbi:MAG: hypothetical protein KDN22_15565 [Verrucomicrobiae bacterium]|nr:hypothetical protein [Verrucomicrobiae bacterium]